MPDTAVVPPAAQADIVLQFGDGRYRFFLPIKAEIEIERLCGGVPLGEIYDELSSSVLLNISTGDAVYSAGKRARRHHARHVIRLAAQYGGEAEIGGETVSISAIDATRLVENYVDGRTNDETVPVAWAILHATLTSVDLKKNNAVAENTSAIIAGA